MLTLLRFTAAPQQYLSLLKLLSKFYIALPPKTNVPFCIVFSDSFSTRISSFEGSPHFLRSLGDNFGLSGAPHFFLSLLES